MTDDGGEIAAYKEVMPSANNSTDLQGNQHIVIKQFPPNSSAPPNNKYASQ